MTFWCVRHVATGQLMPLAQKNRGYSHWNPAHPDHPFESALMMPRLLLSRRSAERVIAGWAALPNGRQTSSQGWDGEYDDDVVSRDDGRNPSELEPVRVLLKVLR